MVDVRFELTTNDPWSVNDAICEGISPLGYWQKVNQSPTQTMPYNNNPLSLRVPRASVSRSLQSWVCNDYRLRYRLSTTVLNRSNSQPTYSLLYSC